MTNNFLDINGAKIWYEEAGTGLPVIFVHAGIADHRMWDDQFPIFAEKYRAIRFDMRGFGQSPMVAGPYSMHEDLYALMRALNVDRAALIGCSKGGQTIIDFAVEHPEMVAALVPVAAGISGYPYPEDDDLPPLIQEIIAADKAGDNDRLNELEIQLWVDGLQREAGSVDKAIRDKVLDMNGIALNTPSDLGKDVPLDPPAYERLNTISAPALAIYGDLDMPHMSDIANHIGAEIPNARVVCLTGTAHLPNMERPQDFNEVVLAFLEGVE